MLPEPGLVDRVTPIPVLLQRHLVEVLQQKLDNTEVPVRRRQVHGRPGLVVLDVEVVAFGEELLEQWEITACGRVEHLARTAALRHQRPLPGRLPTRREPNVVIRMENEFLHQELGEVQALGAVTLFLEEG